MNVFCSEAFSCFSKQMFSPPVSGGKTRPTTLGSSQFSTSGETLSLIQSFRKTSDLFIVPVAVEMLSCKNAHLFELHF